MSTESYHDDEPRQTRKPFEIVKNHVPIRDVAERYTSVDSAGRGKCPIHHGDNPQSFKVYEESRSFHCFSCGVSGSAADLEYECDDYSEPIWAALQLIHDYGLDEHLEPSEQWRRKQARQKPLRDCMEEMNARTLQRRLFHIWKRGYLDNIEDDDLRQEEAEEIWNMLEEGVRAYMRRGNNE